MKRIYLSHPYGGKEENREAAAAITMMYRDILNAEGKTDYEIVNPLELLEGCDGLLSEGTILDMALAMMKGCDVVLFCAGWEDSPGCKREHYEADLLGMVCMDLSAEAEAAAVHWYGRHREIVQRMVA